MSKVYVGYRLIELDNEGRPVNSTCIVTVRTISGRKRPLRPRNDIRNHSPTGFEWGYGGSGPAQLALALVADVYGRCHAVPAIYQHLKRKLISGLPHDGWTLTKEQIMQCVDEIKQEHPQWDEDTRSETGPETT